MSKSRVRSWIAAGAAVAVLVAGAPAGQAQESSGVDLSKMRVRWTKGQSVRIDEQRETEMTFHVTDGSGKVTLDQQMGETIVATSTATARDVDDAGRPTRLRIGIARWTLTNTGNTSLANSAPETWLTGRTLDVTGSEYAFEGPAPESATSGGHSWIASRFAGTDTTHPPFKLPAALVPTRPLAVGSGIELPEPARRAALGALFGETSEEHLDWTASKLTVRLERTSGAGADTIAHLSFTGRIPITKVAPIGSKTPLPVSKDSAITLEGSFSGPVAGGAAPWTAAWSLRVDRKFEMDGESVHTANTSRDTWSIRPAAAGVDAAESPATPDAPEVEVTGPKHDLSKMVASWTKGQVVRLERRRDDFQASRARNAEGQVLQERKQREVTTSAVIAQCEAVDDSGRAKAMRLFVERFVCDDSGNRTPTPPEPDDCLTGAHVTIRNLAANVASDGKAECTDAGARWLYDSFVREDAANAWMLLIPALRPERPLAIGEAWRMDAKRIQGALDALIETGSGGDLDLDAAKGTVTLERLEGEGDRAVAHVRLAIEAPVKHMSRRGRTIPFEPGSKIVAELRLRAPLDGNVDNASGTLSVRVNCSFQQGPVEAEIEAGIDDVWTSRAVDSIPPLPAAPDKPPVAPPKPGDDD